MMKMREIFIEGHVQVLIIDEISMCVANLLEFVNIRLQQIFNSKHQFGGIHVVLLGDFGQLQPVGESLAKAALDGTAGAGLVIRDFRLLKLMQQMRAASDSVHTQRIVMLSGMTGERSINMNMLRETCSKCTPSDGKRRVDPIDHDPFSIHCIDDCLHRCAHLKVLSSDDIVADSSWLLARKGCTTQFHC